MLIFASEEFFMYFTILYVLHANFVGLSMIELYKYTVLHKVQTSCGAHPASNTMTTGCFPKDKVAGVRSLSPTSI
jgi:hypothetical protein